MLDPPAAVLWIKAGFVLKDPDTGELIRTLDQVVDDKQKRYELALLPHTRKKATSGSRKQ